MDSWRHAIACPGCVSSSPITRPGIVATTATIDGSLPTAYKLWTWPLPSSRASSLLLWSELARTADWINEESFWKTAGSICDQ